MEWMLPTWPFFRPVALCILAPVLVGPSGAARATEPSREAARAFRAEQASTILQDFARFLELPNRTGNVEELRTVAKAIVSSLGARGVESRLLEIDGVAPLVFGRLDTPGATRTLGLYVHYDGQPVDDAQWTQAPFGPTLYTAAVDRGGKPLELPAPGEPIDPEWRLYARSSSDDKAPVAAMLAALDALQRAGIELTSNLVFLFEGEEEGGSQHLGDYFRRFGSLLADVDLWLICDGPVHQSRRPQLVFGVRGITGLDITVYGAERYLHSGHYGNWAPNPGLELARLLASMKNAEGRVLVQGFYDDGVPLNDREREALARVPDVDAELRQTLGLATSEANNAPLVERINLPSLNVRGLASATVGDSARNVIPTTAEASLDIRLIQGNDPLRMQELVEAHIGKQGFHIVRDPPDHATRLAHPRIARVVRRAGYPAVRTLMDLPILAPVVAAAQSASDEPLVLMPTLGGSLPLYLFEEVLERPIVIVPIANHDNNQHAPDENLRLANLWYGIDLFAELFTMP
jgi:acetylornithine deacetylase/succinyl-diaminopimelate desuccinylase-like protein